MAKKSFIELKTHAKVDDISYEPLNSFKMNGKETGAIYWIYLKSGWCYDTEGCHTINGPTIQDVKLQLKYAQPCGCNQCSIK